MDEMLDTGQNGFSSSASYSYMLQLLTFLSPTQNRIEFPSVGRSVGPAQKAPHGTALILYLIGPNSRVASARVREIAINLCNAMQYNAIQCNTMQYADEGPGRKEAIWRWLLEDGQNTLMNDIN
jgi:hypothetical protein